VLSVVVAVFVVTRSDLGTYELHATFDDVRGLIEGGDVRAGAVVVGRVEKIEIGEGDRPVVTMSVDESFRLHEGATADIRLASNVGAVNRVVELEQGDVSAPRLRDGSALSVRRTDQPVNFDEAVETLDPRTREDIGDLLGGLDRSVRGRGPDIDRALDNSSAALGNVGDLLAQVNSDGAALRTILTDGERVVSSLASRPEDLGEAAVRVADLLRATAARRREISASVRDLGPALAGARESLDALAEATPELRRLASGVGPVVDALGPLARLLPGAMQATGPLLVQSRRLVERGPAQLKELRPIALAATPVARKLTPVARDALPLARVLQVYVPETVGAFQNFGATAGAYDANGHILNVSAGFVNTLPDSVQSAPPLGPADCDKDSDTKVRPGLLKKPFIRVPGVNECQPWTDLPPGIITPNPEAGG
jgi:phospholipid/cholesterol/gamma-HCH transport system substrate-binding protein